MSSRSNRLRRDYNLYPEEVRAVGALYPRSGRVRSLAKSLEWKHESVAFPVTPDPLVTVAEKLNDLSRSNILGSARDTPDC